MTRQKFKKLVLGKRHVFFNGRYSPLTEDILECLESHDWWDSGDDWLNCNMCGAYVRSPWSPRERKSIFFYSDAETPPCLPLYYKDNVIKQIIQ